MLASRQWAPDEMELQDAPQLAAAAPPWRFPPAARNIHFDEAAKLVTVWDPESSRVDVYGPHADPLAQAVPSTLPERPLSLSHASGTSSPALSSGSSPPWVSRADSLSEKTGRLRVVSAASGAAERRSLGASPQDPPSPASKSVRQSMDRSARIRAYHLSKSYGSGLTARSSLDGPPSPPTPIFSLVIPDPHGSGTSDAPAVGAPAAGESSAGTRNASASSGTRGASGDVSVRISRGHSLVAMWSRGDREVNVVVRGEGSRAKARIYLPAASSERSPQGGGVWGVFWGSGGDVCVASAHGLVGYRIRPATLEASKLWTVQETLSWVHFSAACGLIFYSVKKRAGSPEVRMMCILPEVARIVAPPSALHLTTPHQTILPLPTHLPPACAARAAQDTAACGTKSERPEADGLSGPGSEGEAPGGTGGSATQGGRGGGWAGSGRGVRPLEGKRQRSASTSSVPPGQTASETRAPGPAHGGTAARAQSGDANESERSRSGHGQGDSSISGHSADRAEAHPDANVTVSLADSMAELEVSTRSSVPGIAGATAHTRARLSLGWEVAAAAPDPSGDAAAAAQREEFSFPTQRDTISGNSSLSASLARAGDAPPESSCAAGGYLALEGTSRRGGYVSVGCLVQEEGGATALLTLRCAAGTARRVCQTPVWEPAPRSPGGEPGARRSGSFVQSGAASQGAAAVGELRRSGSIGKGTRGGLGQRTASSLDMGAAHGGTGLAPGERPEKWEMMVLDGVFAVHGRTKGRCCVVLVDDAVAKGVPVRTPEPCGLFPRTFPIHPADRCFHLLPSGVVFFRGLGIAHSLALRLDGVCAACPSPLVATRFLLHRSEPLLKAPRPPAAPETRRCRESLGELAAKDNNGSTPTDAPLQPTQRGADLHPLVTRSWNEPSASEWGRSAAAALQDDVTAVRGLADRAPGPTPSEGLISTLRAALIRQDPVWQLVPIYEELCKAIAWVRANGASLEAAHAPVLEPGVILSDAFVWAKTEEGSPWEVGAALGSMGGASGSANARIVGVSVRLASRQVIAGVVPPLSKGVSTDERRYGYLASALLEWMRVSSSFDIPAPAGMCAEAIEMLSRSGTSGSQEIERLLKSCPAMQSVAVGDRLVLLHQTGYLSQGAMLAAKMFHRLGLAERACLALLQGGHLLESMRYARQMAMEGVTPWVFLQAADQSTDAMVRASTVRFCMDHLPGADKLIRTHFPNLLPRASVGRASWRS